MTWTEICAAWLQDRRYRARNAWLQLTGRCTSCRQRRGRHRFGGCELRPGRGVRLNARKET
jgi:hypothetical protein